MITAISIPAAAPGSFHFFRKVGTRRAQSISKVVLAGVLADRTAVTMRPADEALLRAYVATGEPRDKAGGYGIQVDPATLSHREKERLTRRFVQQIHELVGPTRDIPAPDMNSYNFV